MSLDGPGRLDTPCACFRPRLPTRLTDSTDIRARPTGVQSSGGRSSPPVNRQSPHTPLARSVDPRERVQTNPLSRCLPTALAPLGHQSHELFQDKTQDTLRARPRSPRRNPQARRRPTRRRYTQKGPRQPLSRAIHLAYISHQASDDISKSLTSIKAILLGDGGARSSWSHVPFTVPTPSVIRSRRAHVLWYLNVSALCAKAPRSLSPSSTTTGCFPTPQHVMAALVSFCTASAYTASVPPPVPGA